MANESQGDGSNNGPTYMAHVKKDDDGVWHEHSLEEHLREVSRLAGEYAQPFGGTDWAALAGLWHDLDKYSARFHCYIARAVGESIFTEADDLEAPRR